MIVNATYLSWVTESSVHIMVFFVRYFHLSNSITLTLSTLTLPCYIDAVVTWWRHQMETFSASLALCAGNSPITGEFPSQMPVTRSFDVFFVLRSNKRMSKHAWGWWFETPSRSLWRHCNESLWLIIVFVCCKFKHRFSFALLHIYRIVRDKVFTVVQLTKVSTETHSIFDRVRSIECKLKLCKLILKCIGPAFLNQSKLI